MLRKDIKDKSKIVVKYNSNGELLVSTNTNTGVSLNDGTEINGATLPPGGSGIRGWLSHISQRIASLTDGRYPVDITDGTIINGTSQSASGINLLTGDSNWLDVRAFKSGSFQIIGSAGITSGTIVFEQTNDPSTSASILTTVSLSSSTPSALISGTGINSNSSQIFVGSLGAAYMRVRIASSFTGGNCRCIANLSKLPFQSQFLGIFPLNSAGMPVSIISGVVNTAHSSSGVIVETSVALGANSTFQGGTKNTSRNIIRGLVFTDTNGSLIVEQQISTAWRQVLVQPITGSSTQATIYECKVVTSTYRIRYINGGVAQSTLEITSNTFNY